MQLTTIRVLYTVSKKKKKFEWTHKMWDHEVVTRENLETKI